MIMTVKTEHGTYECRELTFKDRRTLHRMEVEAVDIDGQFAPSKYYDIIEWVMYHAFEDPEPVLGKLSDTEIDMVIGDIYTAYKKPSKKKK